MRRRIYWLVPDLESARRTMDDLLLARIDESHIHFIAREGAELTGLHAANLLQSSDLVRAAQSGLVIGGMVGMACGIGLALLGPLLDSTPQWGLVGALTIAGGLFGAWSASMIGASTPSHRLLRFMPAVERGDYLLMVDVPRGRVDEIEQRLAALHPELHLEGVEPGIPAFP